jgi:putative restriction endonuclease
LCLAASLLVNHRRYGGRTSDRAEEPVPSLARLFRRTNASVLAKMANLDGSRPNGAKHEVEVAALLLSQVDQLVALYRRILVASRDAGVTEAVLPDFLGLEHRDVGLELQGQEELEQRDVEQVTQSASSTWLTHRPDLDERVTQRLLVAAARVGQHRFATEVLANHGHRCVFCGLAVKVAGAPAPRMLVASHIKPWRECTSRERLDFRNGLAACPTHDAAFDTGILTVHTSMRIQTRPEVHVMVERDAPARAVFGRPPLADRLMLPVGAVPPDPRYLSWHQKMVYQLELTPEDRQVGGDVREYGG